MGPAFAAVLKLTRRGRFLQKGCFSMHGPILATRSMWASETLHNRLGNATVTLRTRSTSGLHLFLDVVIHHGRFHGQWARCCGAPLARVQVCLAGAVCDRSPRIYPPKLATPLKQSLAFSSARLHTHLGGEPIMLDTLISLFQVNFITRASRLSKVTSG